MSIQTHLAELERRHHALEQEIDEAQAHPATDDLKLAELKRRKLQVKDEIVRLQQLGRLDLQALVTRRIALEELNDAFRAMQAGEVARSIIVY